MLMRRWLAGLVTAGALGVAACGGGDGGQTTQAPAAPSAAAAGGSVTPDPGGKVITVEMETDELGNRFEPAEFEARRGDVIRFILVTGVHNANFVADSNPAGAKLPPPTPMLQLPGQTHEVKVEMGPGRYYYHCDPHALLGMVGYVTVRE